MTKPRSAANALSVATVQRMHPGCRPGPIKIYGCPRETCIGEGGKTFSRTGRLDLLTLPAGTRRLTESHVRLLRDAGVTEEQLPRIEKRLDELAAASAAHARQRSLEQAQGAVQQSLSAVDGFPENADSLIEALLEAATRLGYQGEATRDEPSPAPVLVELTTNERLLNAFRQLNRAALEAQAVYRQLVKGEQPAEETVLEYQRSWFNYQAVVDAVRGREAFHRPAGWTALKARVLVEGRRWRKGDPMVSEV
jgi:hypothetical protein